MTSKSVSRRETLKTLAAGSLTGLMCHSLGASDNAFAFRKSRHKVERVGVGAVGLRYQGSVDAHKAALYGDIVSVCDVDKNVRDQAKAAFGSTPSSFEDYRDLLKQKSVDVVVIGTPDHWHTQIAADAMRAGKDVYVEKPLTLTIDEGKFLRQVAKETNRVLQVGSWQRSDSRFRLAVEMVRAGRIGELKQVDVVLGKNKQGGPFAKKVTPNALNWNLWQGQTPDVPYLEERCHYTFRWWHEYSGGQMTDWGAHHLDIAQWAIDSYPVEISGQAKYPEKSSDRFNVPVDFHAKYRYQNGVVMTVADHGRNGIMLNGDKGRIFVNRGTVSGKPVDELKQRPLERSQFKCYGFDNLKRPPRAGKLDAIINHMGNFFDCIESRKDPVSDLESQHRSVSTCHLGNIAMRLGRSVKWNPVSEEFVDDKDANGMLKREQRSGFEIK